MSAIAPLVAFERREAERIQAERRQRMLERSAARAVHSAPAAPKDRSDLDADLVRRSPRPQPFRAPQGDKEFPADLDQRWSRWVVVRQLQPGVRLRLPFNIPRDSRSLLNLIAEEEGAKMIFDIVAADTQARSLDADGIEP